MRFINPVLELGEALMSGVNSNIFGVAATTKRLSVVVRHSTILECDDLSRLEILTLTSITPQCETNGDVTLVGNRKIAL